MQPPKRLSLPLTFPATFGPNRPASTLCFLPRPNPTLLSKQTPFPFQCGFLFDIYDADGSGCLSEKDLTEMLQV